MAPVPVASVPPKPTPAPAFILVIGAIAVLTWRDVRRVDGRYPIAWAAGVLVPVLLDGWLDPHGGAPGLWAGITIAIGWLLVGRWYEAEGTLRDRLT